MKRKINPIVYLFQWKRFNTSFMCKRICKKSNTSKMYRKLILFYTCKQNDSLPPHLPIKGKAQEELSSNPVLQELEPVRGAAGTKQITENCWVRVAAEPRTGCSHRQSR